MARKHMHADLNLVPFIDLFSTLICFLLMTAVWNQIEALSTNVESVTTSDSPAPPDPNKVNLTVTVLRDRIEMAENETAYKFSIINGQLPMDKVIRGLEVWREKYPNRKDIILNTENEIPYKYMIATFDTLVGNGWPDVGVNTQ